MEGEKASSSKPELHSCLWCQQVLLDFSDSPSTSSHANTQSLRLPMPFEGFNANGDERSEFIKYINEFLSLSSDAGCLFSQVVVRELGASHGDKPVKALFSWVGGVEFIGTSSSVCLLNYYWMKSACPESLYLDPNTYRIPSNTLRRVKEWFSECEASHTECQHRYETNFIPKRLLRIDRVGATWRVRLIYPPKPCAYTALSYCWGGGQDTMLTASNQRPWASSGPLWEELPRTIQDAILVTFALGIEFIWIDSLCIVQDDVTDKAIQIAQMPKIYDSAMVTLSAVGMASVHDGLFKHMRLPPSVESIFELPVHGAPEPCDRAIFAPSQEGKLTSLEEDGGPGPLDLRAWTFQETLLSRRLLKFTSSTMRWECQRRLERNFDEGKRARIFDRIPLHPAICRMRHHANFNYILQSGQLCCPNGRKSEIPETGFDQPDVYPWHMLVEEYTRRSLSFPQDRALAISGIAERIGNRTGDQYCVGLWRSCLVNQLAWYDDTTEPFHDLVKAKSSIPGWKLCWFGILTAESHPGMVTHQWGGAFSLPIGNDSGQRRVGNPIARQAETKAEKLAAPSWSWMSVPTPVRFRVSGISFTLEIVDVQMQPSIEAAQFGNVDFGVLTVRGPVKPILADIGLDMPSTGSYGSTSTSPLLLKLGELDDTESNSSKKALCLELQKKNENIWIRTGLSESSDAGWLEARIVTIV